MQLPVIAPGKRFTLPRPLGSADALLLARFAQAQAAQRKITAIVPAELDHVPQPGDCFAAGGCGAGGSPAYRTLDQISPGSTPFAVQLGARLRF